MRVATKVDCKDIGYYPFGMVMEEREYTSASYRYGFNGMEKDDEVKGDGNSYDFGARIYDPRIGRWVSLDPLMKKYPQFSPYNFTFNSPILYFDPDGKDGVASINHKTQTITIKAVYFVEVGPKGMNAAEFQALQGLNNTLNAQNYTVTDPTNSLNGYKVKFEFVFQPAMSDKDAQTYAENEQGLTQSNSTGGADLIVDNIEIGNSLILTDNATFDAEPTVQSTAKTYGVQPQNVSGITDGTAQHINIPYRSRGGLIKQLHEIFHTLYFDQDGAKTGIGSGQQLPTSGDINTLIDGFQKKGKTVIEK